MFNVSSISSFMKMKVWIAYWICVACELHKILSCSCQIVLSSVFTSIIPIEGNPQNVPKTEKKSTKTSGYVLGQVEFQMQDHMHEHATKVC